MDYEPVIGLEVHAELATHTKLFCGCSTRFGAEPNTQTCPVCLGMPGVLPAMNRAAFDYVLLTALALGCRVAPRTHCDRKNYYYPDLPKNYQISQNHANLGVDGGLDILVDGEPRTVGILNVHIEEDAGKLSHVANRGQRYSLVDLNRAGVPLIEIVSAPDLRTVAEVEAYMLTLRRTLLYLGVSDCKMQEGSLRFEASVSVRPRGQERLGNRVEIKNLNSISAVLKVVAYETERQTDVLRKGGTVAQETRLWDEEAGRSARMRSKEEAHDYRYFPEPDLVPVAVTDEMRREALARVPELPTRRAHRFVADHGLGAYDAGVLTEERALADFFEATIAAGAQSKAACNWISNQLLSLLNERGAGIVDVKVTPAALAGLLRLIEGGKLSVANGRDVLAEMVDTGAAAETIVEARGLAQIRDAGELEGIVDRTIQANPRILEDYRKGRKNAFNALIGNVMRETKGKANPAAVRELLQKRMEKLA